MRFPLTKLVFTASLFCFCLPGYSQWEEQDQFLSTNELFDIRMQNEMEGVAIGKGNLLLCTLDGGLSWDGGGSFDPDLRSASMTGSKIWFCNNSGSIFSESNPGLCAGELEALGSPALNDMTQLQMLGTSTGFAIANGALWFSNNTWFSSLNVDAATTLNTLWFFDESAGFTGAENGRITKYTQVGSTWIPDIVFNTGQPIRGMYFTSTSNGYVCGDNGSVFRTQDGGDNWSEVCVPVSDQLNGIFATSESTVHTVGQNIYKSTDGGENWFLMPSPSTPDLNAIWFLDENEGWVVGRSGFIGHTGNAGGSGTLLVKSGTDPLPEITAISPNPASDLLWVSTASPIIRWTLHNLTGQLLGSGMSVPIEVSDFNPGMYLLRVQTEFHPEGLTPRQIIILN